MPICNIKALGNLRPGIIMLLIAGRNGGVVSACFSKGPVLKTGFGFSPYGQGRI
jgi:hypothetical protein